MSTAVVGGREVFFEQRGSAGPRVVLLHSLGADHSIFSTQSAALSDDYSVLSFDMRGHGRSALDEQSPSLDVLADDLMALLSQLNISEAHLVGQSIGGMTILCFASRFPDWPGSFAVLSAVASTDEKWDRKYVSRGDLVEAQGVQVVAEDVAEASLGFTTRLRHPELVTRYTETLKGADKRGYAWACRAMIGFDLRPSLAAVRGSVLVATGEEDTLAGAERAQEIADLIHGSQLRIISECGHVPCLEQPDAVTQLLADWFRRGD
jgi:pimeloyl-ACP methyl ester carboxylesterase